MNFFKSQIRILINELFLYKHFNDRVFDRLKNITDIIFPKELHEEFNKDNKKINEHKSFILNYIKSEVSSKIDNLKNIKGPIDNNLHIIIISKALIQYKDKLYIPILQSVDKPNQVNGNVWFSGIYNDVIKTLLIGRNDDESYIINQFKQHYIRKDNEAEDIKNDIKDYIDSDKFDQIVDVKKLPNYIIKVNLNELLAEKPKDNPIIKKEKTINPIKADYRKGAKYIHPKFGIGTILSKKFIEEKEEDSINYRYYNVEIQFDKPYGIKVIRLKSKN